jgi:phage terminase large subunit-like protein
MGLRGIGGRGLKERKVALAQADDTQHAWDDPKLSRADKVIAFVEDLTITSGELSFTKLKLRPFQREFIHDVYQEKGGHRPIRTAILSLGRKNGKTQLAAALALCHLCGPESESRGEVYSCANDRAQAAKVFSEMAAMVSNHPWLDMRCNIIRFTKQIEDMANGSVFMALSSEAATKFGLSPSFVVFDELGQAPNRELYDAMDTAQGGRKDPLMMVISTQAADDHAPMSQLIDYGLQIQKKKVADPSFYMMLFAASEKLDPFKQSTWKLANPALGDFRSLEDVQRLAKQAQRMPSRESAFRNLILNQRVAAHAKFIEKRAWEECGNVARIPDGAKVFAGLDLGSTLDLSALVIVHQDLDGVFHVQPFIWVPGNLRQRAINEKVPYDTWEKQGFVIKAGDSTDPKLIALKLAELAGRYRIQSLAFDRWRMHDLQRELDAIGAKINLVAHGQGFKDMSPAVDTLERLITQKRIRHSNHPVLSWMAGNAVVTIDAAKNRKLDKSKSSNKIDGIVALCMAFSVALIMKQEPIVDIDTLIA